MLNIVPKKLITESYSTYMYYKTVMKSLYLLLSLFEITCRNFILVKTVELGERINPILLVIINGV